MRSRKAASVRVAAVVSAAAAVSVLVFPSAAGAVPVPWRNCGLPTDVIHVQDFVASVWPPVAGEKLTLKYQAVVSETIPYATETVQMTVGQRPPISFTAPFEFPRAAAAKNFPIRAGPYVTYLYFTVPKSFEGFTIGLTVSATSITGAPLICAQFQFPIIK